MEIKYRPDIDDTIKYYETHAASFIESTINADVTGLYEPFEKLLFPGARILDLGCGSGRDSKYFFDRGYNVVAVDPAQTMCEQTRSLADILVIQTRAEQIDFHNEFDGVWACASLLHINRADHKKVLLKIAKSLKTGGVFYSSWKYGEEDRIVGERRFTDFNEQSLRRLLDEVSAFDLIKMWTTQDVRPDNNNQKWLNVLLKKKADMNIETDNRLSKARLLTLVKMLYEKTDDENKLTTSQILNNLRDLKIHSNDKTLRRDIDMLKELGFDVIVEHSKPNRYHIGDRGFDLAEIKLLIDAVASSRFVTEKKSQELGEKLAKLASENQRPQLIRHIHAINRVKSDNPENFYNVDIVNEAINSRKKISFKYTEYNRYKEKVFRNYGEIYELSPYALFWNEDYYYVVGWNDKHGNVSVFRTDRLYKPEILNDDAVSEPEDFNLEDYSKQIFEMFDGKEVDVVLECKNEFMKYIIDRFGENVDAEPVSRNTFEARVRVALSPTFYAWVFTFEGGIRIVSPENAVEDIISMSKKLIKVEKK